MDTLLCLVLLMTALLATQDWDTFKKHWHSRPVEFEVKEPGNVTLISSPQN